MKKRLFIVVKRLIVLFIIIPVIFLVPIEALVYSVRWVATGKNWDLPLYVKLLDWAM